MEKKKPVLKAKYKVVFNGLDLKNQWYVIQDSTDEELKLAGKWYPRIYFEVQSR